MKVIVIGLGSMGKRRIRLIKEINSLIEIVGVDSKENRTKECAEKYGIRCLNSLDEAFEETFDCAFVCTSPLSHASIISKCLDNNMHVFTEINLVSDMYDENISKARDNNKVLFLSSTFLYRDEIGYIKSEVDKSNSILSYTYHIGQYLPDWHPWENYTDYFIGNPETNGCREIMAIDFPWIYKTFGAFKTINVLKGKKTTLNISYPDSFLLLIEHENGVQGTISIDVVSRKAVRNLEIYGEDLYISWDGSEKGLKKYNIETKKEEIVSLYSEVSKADGYASFVVENAYKNEIQTFFDMIAGKKMDIYGFKEDKYILRTIDCIESDGE